MCEGCWWNSSSRCSGAEEETSHGNHSRDAAGQFTIATQYIKSSWLKVCTTHLHLRDNSQELTRLTGTEILIHVQDGCNVAAHLKNLVNFQIVTLKTFTKKKKNIRIFFFMETYTQTYYAANTLFLFGKKTKKRGDGTESLEFFDFYFSNATLVVVVGGGMELYTL